MSQLHLNLRELVAAVRAELEQVDTARKKANRDPLFRLSGMELELTFVVEANTTAKGGFDIKVLTLGGEVGGRNEHVQRVLLKYDVPQEFQLGSSIGVFAGVPSPSDKDPVM